MNTLKHIFLSGLVIAAAFGLTACNAIEDQSQSNSLLTVLSLQGTDSKGNAADFLNSDVVNMSSGSPTIYADSAAVSIRNLPLDPNPIGSVSQFYDVLLTRYVVSYSQPNGANQEGVDVPYSFEGNLSILVPINGTADFGFVIVREVAKMEPPLAQLQNSLDVLQVTAKIDFYGHDLANHKVSTTGYLTIYFANYADSSSGATLSPRGQK